MGTKITDFSSKSQNRNLKKKSQTTSKHTLFMCILSEDLIYNYIVISSTISNSIINPISSIVDFVIFQIVVFVSITVVSVSLALVGKNHAHFARTVFSTQDHDNDEKPVRQR